MYAFTAFEGKYSTEYADYNEMRDILWMGSTLSWVVGSNNLASIEEDYLSNVDSPYINGSEFTGSDAILFDNLVNIGSSYELLTSLNHMSDELLGNTWIGNWIREHGASDNSNLQPKDLILLMLIDRLLNGGSSIDTLTAALLQQVKDPSRNEGLLDSGVYRDQVANRLGIGFGIQVFNNPASVPVIPYDVYGQLQNPATSPPRYEFP